MNVLIHIERLCMAGVDERVARETLVRLREELEGRGHTADWSAARIPVLRAQARGNDARQLARALADALLRSKP